MRGPAFAALEVPQLERELAAIRLDEQCEAVAQPVLGLDHLDAERERTVVALLRTPAQPTTLELLAVDPGRPERPLAVADVDLLSVP